MSETPNFPALTPQAQNLAAQIVEQRVQALTFRAQIIAERSAQDAALPNTSLQGRVRDSNPQDGRITIQTPRGEVTLQILEPTSPRALPAEGALVRLNITNNGQAEIRAEPPQQSLPPRDGQTPVRVDLGTGSAPLPPQPLPQNIRIEQLPLAQALPLLFEPSETLQYRLAPPPPLPSASGTIGTVTALPELSILQISLPSPNILIQAPSTPLATLSANLLATTSNQGILPQSFGETGAGNQSIFIAGITPPPIQIVAPEQNTPLNLIQQQLQSFATERIAQPHSSSQTMTGVVAGHTPQNLPIIALSHFDGSLSRGNPDFFILHQPHGEILAGSTLSISPLTPSPQTNPENAARLQNLENLPWPQVSTMMLSTGTWESLNDIRAILSQASAQVAQAMSALTPSPAAPQSLGALAVLFISAFKGGSLESWLGERGIEALQKAGKSSMLSRLSQEGNALLRLFGESTAQEWRALSLPLYYEQEFHRIALHYRQENEPNTPDQEKGNKRTRFIFDLTLDAMGDVQIDGLFHGKRLDLILRTEQPFTAAARHSIKGLYANALENARLLGEITFQHHRNQWASIDRDVDHFDVDA